MSSTGWAINFLDPSKLVKDAKTQKYRYKQRGLPIGNYHKYGSRMLDNVMVFRGLYGVKSYMIWEMHQDIGFYDFGSSFLDLKLMLEGAPKRPFFNDIYRPISVKYNSKRSKYIVYAVSEDSIMLDTPIAYESSKHDPPVKGWEVLKTIMENEGKFSSVHFHVHPSKSITDYDYALFPRIPNLLTYELIRYICDDNNYEWCVKNRVLHIGGELKAIRDMRSGFQVDIAEDKVAEAARFKFYTGKTIPADVLSHWDEKWKCVWVKHVAGKCGGMTRAIFSKIGGGQVSLPTYHEILDRGCLEKHEASRLLQQPRSINMMIGNVINDSGENEYIDSISIQKNDEKRIQRVPHEIQIDRNDGKQSSMIQNQIDNASRLSPYLDENAGILFPSQKLLTPLSHPPNCVVGFAEGKIQSPIVLGFLYGNGRGVLLPTKSQKEDLRLQLPNGWCLYIDGLTGETFLQSSSSNAQVKPTVAQATIYIDPVGNVTIGGAGALTLALSTHLHSLSSHTHICAAPGAPSAVPIPDITGASTQNTTKTKAE